MVMQRARTFVIAEAGVNHNGSDELALRLVDVAADCGADAVKFQTFTADNLVVKGAEKAEYQKRATGAGDQHDMLKALEMSEATHRKLVKRCAERDIEFMSTAFDEQALDMLVDLGIRRVKVPSGELTNLPLLRAMAAKDLPMVVSTGMATLAEVEEAVTAIAETRSRLGFRASMAEMVTILHCTSNYPAAAADVNLNAMLTLAQTTGLAVGYSDHTLGISVSSAAVAMGAVVIEKHFTLDKTMPGPDHAASLEPNELKALVDSIREIEAALGDGIKAPTDAELSVRSLVRRSVTAARDIRAGQAVGEDDVVLMRPGTGIPARDFEKVLGKRAAKDMKAGQLLAWTDLE